MIDLLVSKTPEGHFSVNRGHLADVIVKKGKRDQEEERHTQGKSKRERTKKYD